MKFEQKASTPVNFSNTDTERVVLVTERLDPCQTAPRTIKTREFSHIRHRCMPECMRREEGPRPHTVLQRSRALCRRDWRSPQSSQSSAQGIQETKWLCKSEVDADLFLIGLEEMRIAQREQAQEGHVLEEHDVDGAPDRINTGLLMERNGDAPQRCTAE